MKTTIKLFISGIFLIISLFAILWLILKFWTIPFAEKIEVVNNTTKNIFITPYGRKMDSGQSAFTDIGLPTYYFSHPPSLINPINNSFEIQPHETKTLWFDINEAAYDVDYILIFGVKDKFSVMRVYPEYDKENKFTIFEGMETSEAKPEVIKLIHENSKGFINMMPDLLMFIGLFNLYYFFKLIKKLKAEKRAKKNMVSS